MPPYAIVVGNNRILRYRFSDEIISDLLELNWWDYNLPLMIKQGLNLPLDKPQEFIPRFKDLSPEILIPFQKTWYFMEVPAAATPLDKIELRPVAAVSQYFDPRAQETDANQHQSV